MALKKKSRFGNNVWSFILIKEDELELKLALLDEWQSACTHCGICSDSCITFQATGWEHQSPRGRIRLAKDLLDGKIEPGSSALQTFDQCLGCHACEVRCPLNVSYAKIRNSVQELRSELAPAGSHNRKWGQFVDRIRSWLRRIPFFGKSACQKSYSKKEDYFLKQDYAWILNELADSRLVLPEACTVYYQPYCGQKEKGAADPVWQLLNRIENLSIQKLPFPLSCCGGFGGKAISHPAEAQQWGKVKFQDLPQNAVIVIISPDCWNQCKAYEGKNFQVLYPIQLLQQHAITIESNDPSLSRNSIF